MMTLKHIALATTLALATPAAADLENMTDAERKAFGENVRTYLLANPEVLMEAIGVLEERQAQTQELADRKLVQDNYAKLYNEAGSWIGGNANGDITLVEFADYRCGYCKRAHPEVAELIKSDGNIRYIIKEFPILGEQSMLAARFAVAVLQSEGPEAYKDINDGLMALNADVTPATLRKLADAFGLDADALLAKMEDPEVESVIMQNRALAQALSISGTPTFVLQDQMLRGYVPLADMRDLVENIRSN